MSLIFVVQTEKSQQLLDGFNEIQRRHFCHIKMNYNRLGDP